MESDGLTTFALVFMLVSMGAVTALTVYCYYRILTTPGPEDPGSAGPAGSRTR